MSADHDKTTPNSEEQHRQAAALNHLLGEIGLSEGEQSQWWNLVPHPDLGGRTATQAWLAGDTEAVTTMVERWYATSATVADRVSLDSEFLGLLRRKLAALAERNSHERPLHRSA